MKSMVTPCPVCDRIASADAYEDDGGCAMWATMLGRRCIPSVSEFNKCYARAKPWREKFDASQLELADVKAKLAAAQGALSRLHAKQIEVVTRRDDRGRLADMFPDDARIE